MAKELHIKDSVGVVREITELHVKDGAGVVREVIEGYIKDPSGNIRQFWPAVAPFNPPVNTVAPVISGPSAVGGTLTLTSLGTWTGLAPITYSQQWRNAGVNISGETGTTYQTQAADIGDNITCYVTATNADGSASQSSNSIIPSSSISGNWNGVLSGTWNGTQSSANVELNSDGTVNTVEITGSSASGTWFDGAPVGSIGSQFEARFSITGGNTTPSGAAVEVWIALNLNPSWFLNNTTNGTIQIATGTIEVREIANIANIFSKTQSLTADNS